MRDVYVQADMVIIWLSQEQADDQVGLDLALKLYELLGKPNEQRVIENYMDLEAVSLPALGSPNWSVLASLLCQYGAPSRS